MQIQVWFANEKYIDIKLFDNSAATTWFNRFKQLNLTNYYNGTIFKNLIHEVPLNETVVTQRWNIILSAVDTLRNIGFDIPFQLPTTFDRSQATLNMLHRFFTYNALWYQDNILDSSIPNPFDKNFKLPNTITSYEDWLDIIDNINDMVHMLENFTVPTSNKTLCLKELDVPNVHIFPANREPTDLSPWVDFTEDELQYNYTYLDSNLPLVILDRSILGKPVLQSFQEEDDLSAKDCTGRVGSYGGFHIDLNANRKKIYESQQFKNWAEKHNKTVDTLPLEFSIGYVTNYDDVIKWCTIGLPFKKLVFVD